MFTNRARILRRGKCGSLHNSSPDWRNVWSLIFSYVNPATCVENGLSSDTESEEFDSDDEEENEIMMPTSNTRISKIDLSQEAVQKRKEAYNKWLDAAK